MDRSRLAEYLADLVGSEAIGLEDAGNGWPALAAVRGPDGRVAPIALYLASVGLSQRGRDDVERRIQVKGGWPIEDDGYRSPVLLGVWHDDAHLNVHRPVVFAADARRRLGRTTQVSVFVALANLQEAASLGWSTYGSSTGEAIVCFLPELLPVALAALEDRVVLADRDMQTAVAAAGLLDDLDVVDLDEAKSRARRASQVLVRDAKFARRVRAAYDSRCAMCCLGMDIVEAAHIVPVAAATDDSPRNGLALCPNHHRLFDHHLVAVDPESARIEYHPEVRRIAVDEPEVARVIEDTQPYLASARPGGEPRPDAFRTRYAHFEGRYDWLRR